MIAGSDWGTDQLMRVVGTLAMLGSAVVGGIFFAFSSFIMKALASLPIAAGIGAMQAINIVVINPSFLGVFFGTALLSLVAGGLALWGWDHSSAPLFLAAALFYLVGTILVTMFGNVPLNNRLAAVSAADPDIRDLWEPYLSRWTIWNHGRAAGAIIGALLYILGLLQMEGS